MSDYFLPPPESSIPIESLDEQNVETQTLDDSTYEPTAYLEQTSDYQQAEAIQGNFETVVDNSTTESAPTVTAAPPDIEQQNPDGTAGQQIMYPDIDLPGQSDTQASQIETTAEPSLEGYPDEGEEPPLPTMKPWETPKVEEITTVTGTESAEPQLPGETITGSQPGSTAEQGSFSQAGEEDRLMEAGVPDREMLPKEKIEQADQISGIGTEGSFTATNVPETIPGVIKPSGTLGDLGEDFSPTGIGESSGGAPQGWGNFPGQEGHGSQKGADYGENFGGSEPHTQGGGPTTSGSGLPVHGYGPGLYGDGSTGKDSKKDEIPELPGMTITVDSPATVGGDVVYTIDILSAETLSECSGMINRISELGDTQSVDLYIVDCGTNGTYTFDPKSGGWSQGQDIDGIQPIPYTGKMFYEGNLEDELKKDYTGGHDEDSGHVLPIVGIDGHGGPETVDPGELDDTGRAYGGINGPPRMYPDSGGALPIDPIPASEAEDEQEG